MAAVIRYITICIQAERQDNFYIYVSQGPEDYRDFHAKEMSFLPKR